MQPLGNRHYFPNSQLNLPVGKVRCRPLGARDTKATVYLRGHEKSHTSYCATMGNLSEIA